MSPGSRVEFTGGGKGFIGEDFLCFRVDYDDHGCIILTDCGWVWKNAYLETT